MDQAWGGWGAVGSMLSDVVSAVEGAAAYVQDDLQEFVGTVSGDAAAAVQTTVDEFAASGSAEDTGTTDGSAAVAGVSAVSGALAKVASSIASNMKEDRGSSAGKHAARQARRSESAATAPLGETRAEAQARQIRHDPETYLSEPADPVHFSEWKEQFELASQVTEVSTLLSTDASLRRMQAKLVPRKISYNQFWIRYFYALALIEAKDAKRKALLDKFVEQDTTETDDWGEDEWGTDGGTGAAEPSPTPHAAANTPAPAPPALSEPEPEPDLQTLRAQIKEFDDAFKAEHGRKPTAADRRPIKKTVALFKKLKNAKSLPKEDAEALVVTATSATEPLPRASMAVPSPDAEGSTSKGDGDAAEEEGAVAGDDWGSDGDDDIVAESGDLNDVTNAQTDTTEPTDADNSADAVDDGTGNDALAGISISAEAESSPPALATVVEDSVAAKPATSPKIPSDTDDKSVELECSHAARPVSECAGSSTETDSDLGVRELTSDSAASKSGQSSSSSSFEVIESPTKAAEDTGPTSASEDAGGDDDDDWGEW